MAGRFGDTEKTNEVSVSTTGVTTEMTEPTESPTDVTAEPSESPSCVIESLSFTDDSEITVKAGETESPGYLKVTVSSFSDFTSDDVIFVSENSEIAEICASEGNKFDATKISFQITGISGGETNVYAMSKDESVKSEYIHVIVSEPVVVESIELQGFACELAIGQTTKATATVEPSNAENPELAWASSDEAVATVDSEGNVVAVGGGAATITAVSTNGIESSFDVTVDGTKALMKLSVRHARKDDVNIGSEWTYDIEINGEPTANTIDIVVGETLSLYAEFTESDEMPDVGTATASHTVTEEDIKNGFEVTMDLNVTENGGRNRGKTAQFLVTFTFSPYD
jgi:nucleoside diphosphate kinase